MHNFYRTESGSNLSTLLASSNWSLAFKHGHWACRYHYQQNSWKRILDCLRSSLHSSGIVRKSNVHQTVESFVLHPDLSGLKDNNSSSIKTNFHTRMDQAWYHSWRNSLCKLLGLINESNISWDYFGLNCCKLCVFLYHLTLKEYIYLT